jgi:light-regulated signal transduction histidine kinase (bacteriophytochrome)
LRHIEGFVEILVTTKGPQLDDEARRYLDTISESVRQMGRLIDDLLSFSRTARAELKKGSVELSDVVESAIRELRQEPDGREVRWEMGKLPLVDGDAALLKQVMLNLIGNALKYTRTRSPARIEIFAVPDPSEDIVAVRDNGVGFDMRYAHKLFGVFQRLHRAADFEGSGIGLANVRRILARHGGRTWADGEIDKGATFYIALPRKQTLRPATPYRRRSSAPTASRAIGKASGKGRPLS